MRKMTAWVFVMVFIMSAQLALAEVPTGELRIGLTTLYDQTFHPIWGSTYRKSYLGPMYDFIIGIDKNGKLDPKQSLAYKWEVSKNMLEWTFYIRSGVKFHNGDLLTNVDVKYTIEQAGTKKNGGQGPSSMAPVSRVEAVAPNKVVVHLKKPWPNILYALSDAVGAEGMVQPKAYIEEKGDDYFRSHPVGSGPYKLYEWKEGVYVKLVAQDSHWRVGVPKYKYLTFTLMPELGARDAALRAGEMDIVATGLKRAKDLKDAGYVIRPKQDSIFLGMTWLNYSKPEYATHNKKVRQALIYAINKKEIIDKILLGQGKLVGSAAAMFTWAIEYKDYPPTPYDPKLAKKLLAEAGYPDGFNIDIYSFVTNLPEAKVINEAVAGYWGAIGVKARILEMDYAAFKPYWTHQKETTGPAMFMYPYANRPVYSWRVEYHSSSIYGHAKDPQLDKMIEDFENAATTKQYIVSARGLMDYVLNNFYATGMCTTSDLFATNKKVPVWEIGRGAGSYRWEYIGVK